MCSLKQKTILVEHRCDACHFQKGRRASLRDIAGAASGTAKADEGDATTRRNTAAMRGLQWVRKRLSEGRYAVLRWTDGIVKEMKLKRTEGHFRSMDASARVCASAQELEADQTCGELNSARAPQARDAGGEERLSGGEDGVRRVSEVA